MTSLLRFRYSLETVLGVHRCAQDVVRAEELNARGAALAKEEHAAEIRELVAGLEQQVRELLRVGGNLDLQRQELLARYLANSRQRLEATQNELAQAEKVHEQVRLRLQAETQKVRALERHRETTAKQHSRALASAEYKAQDELWMGRIAGR